MSKTVHLVALKGLALVVIGALTALYVSLDLHYAISLNTVVLIAVGCAGALVFLALRLIHPSRRYGIGLVLFLAMIVAVRFIDWDSRKPFLRALAQVTPGMSRTQVEQVMAGFIQLTPAFAAGEPQQLVFRHTDEGWGNADVGMVTFEDHQVVDVQFFHD